MVMNLKHIGPSHHSKVFQPSALKTVTQKMLFALNTLRSYFPNLKAVAGTGHSGSMVVGAVAAMSDYMPILVRKAGERGIIKNNPAISGAVGDFDYVILDDLVSSGETAVRIQEKVLTEWKKAGLDGEPPRCVAVLCYDAGSNRFDRYATIAGAEGIPVLNINYPLGGEYEQSWAEIYTKLPAIRPITRKPKAKKVSTNPCAAMW